MAKAKVYGFSPWVDQVDAINQIMRVTGERNESALLRKLVDEALDARRQRIRSAPLTEESDHDAVRLETIESLLMQLVREGDVSFRIEDVCYEGRYGRPTGETSFGKFYRAFINLGPERTSVLSRTTRSTSCR